MTILEFNLLPEEFRRPEKIVRLKLCPILLAGVTIVLVAFLIFVYTGQTRKLGSLATRISETQGDIAKLQESIRLTEDADNLKEGLTENINAINALANQNVERVTLLQKINSCIQPQMSLVSLEQRNHTYLITGYAMSNLTVARFIDKLQASERFQHIALTFIKPRVVNEEDVLSFEINSTVNASSIIAEDS